MLIRLSDVRSVAARTISSIEVRTDHVAVQTDDGTCYRVGCDYGKSASATRDRLEAVINAALAAGGKAMTRASAKNVQMACLKIGHYDYLMPAAKAIKVAELMQDAFDCDRDYGDADYRYTVKATQPNVSFSLVRANQVRMPEGEPVPPRIAKPRLLK